MGRGAGREGSVPRGRWRAISIARGLSSNLVGAAGNHRGQEQARENWLGHFATPPSQRLPSFRSSKHSSEPWRFQTRLKRPQHITVNYVPRMQASGATGSEGIIIFGVASRTRYCPTSSEPVAGWRRHGGNNIRDCWHGRATRRSFTRFRKTKSPRDRRCARTPAPAESKPRWARFPRNAR